MPNWKKRIRIGCISSLVLIVLVSQIASGCISFSMSDKKFDTFYAEKSHKPISKFYKVDGYEMHYMYQDMDQEASLVFVHGTPGSWSAFADYFNFNTLYKAANIVSPDRPGFGKSSYGKPKRSLEEQAKYTDWEDEWVDRDESEWDSSSDGRSKDRNTSNGEDSNEY